MAINNIFFTVSGDCQNTNLGAYDLTIYGTSPDYRIEFINPGVPSNFVCNGYISGSFVFLTGSSTQFKAYNLTAGTYSLQVYDSDTPNDSKTVSINVSSGTCVSVDNVVATSCGLNNGSVTAVTTSSYSTYKNFYLYDDSDNLITSSSTASNYFNYDNSLSAGTYYFIGDDGSGCSGRTESFIVKSSNTLTYSLYTINNSACGTNLGKIYVSGLTGVYPFTYQWSNGITGYDFITGLTAGAYSVTVTDGNGCSVTQSTVVNTADPLIIDAYTFNPPSCLNNDGEITIYFQGGSAPYNVQCSNLDYQIIFDNHYTFQNLSSGIYTFTIVDAGLCVTTGTFTLLPTNSFTVQSVNVVNSNCNTTGSIQVGILGAAGSYDYVLSGTSYSTNGNFVLTNGGNYNLDIINLSADTYNITITSTTSVCSFNNVYTVGNTSPFTISTSVTGTTCGNNNGIVEITASQGYIPNLKFTLNSNTNNNGQTQTVTTSAVTFTNLQAGNYLVTVKDTNGIGCTVTSNFDVNPISSNVDFLPLIVNNDQITVSITQGQPPFTLYWSSSTLGFLTQTGTTISGLTPGSYNVIVYDSNNCFKQSETVTVVGTTTNSFSSSYSVCDTTLGSTIYAITKKLSQVFFDGYVSAISANTACNLALGVFTSNVYVNNNLYSDSFYTATTLNEVVNMSDSLWYTSIKNVLMSIYGIGDVSIDIFNNQIKIDTDCNLPGNILAGASILIDLQVDYVINCRFCTGSFTNCDNPLDEITIGIVTPNFMIGDVVLYNNNCYQLNTNSPIGLAVTNVNYPDFTGPSACSDCLSIIP